MKKLFTIIAIAFALLGGNANQANAQTRVIVANPDWAYDHCRDNVLHGDDEFRRGAYNTAEWYYGLALSNNRDCPNRKYISDAELSRKIDECHFASQHNGMTRHEYDQQQRYNAQAALVNAIAIAAANRQNNNAAVAQQMMGQNSNGNSVLRSYTNNGISYDSNQSNVKITKVERTNTATIVHFEFLNLDADGNININPGTYLKDKATGMKYILEDTDGIYTNNRLHIDAGDSHDFTLTFSAVSKDCHSIDIVEPGDTGWKFYHINI